MSVDTILPLSNLLPHSIPAVFHLGGGRAPDMICSWGSSPSILFLPTAFEGGEKYIFKEFSSENVIKSE